MGHSYAAVVLVGTQDIHIEQLKHVFRKEHEAGAQDVLFQASQDLAKTIQQPVGWLRAYKNKRNNPANRELAPETTSH
jgi:hypothetical protein